MKAQIVEPNYFLQRKLGGPAGRMINPLSIKRAEVALLLAVPPIDEEVRRLLQELTLAITTGEGISRTLIWGYAHEIRGIADTADRVRLGEAADIMCRYLHGTDPTFSPDPAVLSTIATVATLALRDGADSDPMVAQLLADSTRAVDSQRHREGRGEFTGLD